MTQRSRYTLPEPENRAAPRKRLAIEVQVQFAGEEPLPTKLRDLSISGFSASTPVRMPAASLCLLTLPGRAPMEAKVVWCEGGLVGCAFTKPMGEITYDAIMEQWEAHARR